MSRRSFDWFGVQITWKELKKWYEEQKRLSNLFEGRLEIQYECYPLEPIQKPNSRDMVYPKHHGRCYWCGQELTGRKRSYCCDKHRSYYWFWFSWDRVRQSVFIRENNTCQCCGKKKLWFNKYADHINDLGEVDHIKAIALGGSNWDLYNLQLLCHECHINKTRKDIYKIRGSIKKNQLELTEFISVK